jgi:hypothetical protein
MKKKAVETKRGTPQYQLLFVRKLIHFKRIFAYFGSGTELKF